MARLGVDYIDLMLLHQPMGDYINAWKGLEKLYKDGKLKAIGMANCYPHVLVDLCETFEIKPMLNQVEMHPFFQQQLNIDIRNCKLQLKSTAKNTLRNYASLVFGQ